MSYILIQNKGELPLWGVRLLGYNEKTEDDIGRFGTGLKESIALLARLGQLPIIYSGTCRIDLKVLDENGPPEIHFKLSEAKKPFSAKKWHGMSIHPDFGKSDWNDPWMVFRELICNALDESGVEDLHHDVTSHKPSGVAGSTRIYLPMCQSLLAAYSTVQEKLLMLSDHEVVAQEGGTGKIIAKRENKGLQVFTKGVWVQEHASKSLFDYDLNNLELNESRSADWYYVNLRIARLLTELPWDLGAYFLDRTLKQDDFEYYESDSMVLTSATTLANVSKCKSWVQAFHTIYGKNAVICTNEKFYYDKLNDVGKKAIVITHSPLYAFLKETGIPCACKVLTREQKEYETLEQPSEAAQRVFDGVWQQFHDLDITNGKPKPGLMLFRQRAGTSRVVFGAYSNGICHINMDCSGSAQERAACVEEIAHHVTEAVDHSREFQHFLVESLEKALHQRSIFTKEEATL